MGQGSSQLESLIPEMQEAIEKPEVQIIGLKSITSFVTSSSNNRTLAMKAGATEIAVTNLKQHKKNDRVINAACDLLSALMSDEACSENAAKIALEEGAVSVLVRYLKQFSRTKKHKKQDEPELNTPLICLTIHVLTDLINAVTIHKEEEDVELINAKMKKADFMHVLTNLFQKDLNFEITQELCKLITAYCTGEFTDKGALEEAQCIEALLSLYKKHSEDDDVAPHVLKTITAVCNFSTMSKNKAIEAHFVKDLTAVIKKHSCKLPTLNSSMDTLGYLCIKNRSTTSEALQDSIILDIFQIIRDSLDITSGERKEDRATKVCATETLYESVFLLSMLTAYDREALKLFFKPETEKKKSSEEKPSERDTSEKVEEEEGDKEEKKEEERDKDEKKEEGAKEKEEEEEEKKKKEQKEKEEKEDKDEEKDEKEKSEEDEEEKKDDKDEKEEKDEEEEEKPEKKAEVKEEGEEAAVPEVSKDKKKKSRKHHHHHHKKKGGDEDDEAANLISKTESEGSFTEKKQNDTKDKKEKEKDEQEEEGNGNEISGIELLLKVLKQSDASPRTQSYCFVTLSALASLTNKREELSKSGVLEAAINALKKGSKRVWPDALRCVRRYFFDDAHTHKVARDEHLPAAVVSWLKGSFPNAHFIEQSCALFRTICIYLKNDFTPSENGDALLTFPGLGKEIMDQLSNFLQVQKNLPFSTQESIIGAIAEDIMLSERDRETVPRFIMTITPQLLHENSDSKENCVGLIHSVGCFARHCLILEEDLVIVPLTTAMRKHIESPEVQSEACRTLYHLFMRSKWSIEPASKEGAIKLLMEVLTQCSKTGSSMRRAQVYALPALAEAARAEDIANIFITSNGLTTLSALLESQETQEDSLQSCFMLAMTLSRSNDMNRTAISKSKVLQFMVDNLNERHIPGTTLTFILKTLCSLVLTREAANYVSQSSVVQPVMKILHSSRVDPKFSMLKDLSILTLANIATKCPSSRSKILGVGGVDEIMELMLDSDDDFSIVRSCLLAFSALAFTADPTLSKQERERDIDAESGAEALASHGAIPAIIKCMQTFEGDVGVQHNGCIALGNIIHKSRERCGQLDAADGLNTVLSAMRTYSTELALQTEGIRFLFKYCDAGSASESLSHVKVVGKEGARMIISAMRQFSDSAPLAEVSAKAIAAMAESSEKMKRSFIRQDTVDLLVKAARELQMYPSLEKALTAAIKVLNEEALKDAFVDDETKVEEIMNRLKLCGGNGEGEIDVDDADKVLSALVSLTAGNKKIINMLMEQKIIISLSPFMKMISDEVVIARRCTRAVFIFAEANEEAKQTLMKYGIVSQIVNAMTLFATDAQVQKNCCALFSVLAMKNEKNINAIVSAGGIPLVITAMKNHRSESEVQRYAGFALSALVMSRDPSVNSLIKKEKAVDEIIESIRRFQQSPVILEFDMLALANIGLKSSEHVKNITDLGGVNIVIDAVNAHSENVKLVKNAFFLASVLMSKDNEANRVAFGKAEPPLVPVAIRMLAHAEKGPDSSSIVKYSFLFCANLALTPGNRSLFSNQNAVDAMIHAYEVQSDMNPVICEAGRAISKITLDNEKNQELFYAGGIIPLLGKSVEKNPTVPQIAQYHCLSLGQILNAVKKSQKEPLLGANLIAAVFEVVKRNSCSTVVIEALAFTMDRAVTNSTEDRDFFAKKSAMPVILFMLKQLSDNPKIISYAADMLSAMFSDHEFLATQFIQDMNGVPLIMELLQMHSLEEMTCGSLLKCLAAIFQVNKDTVRTFIQLRGPQQTLVALRGYTQSETVQEAGAAVLSSVLTSNILSARTTMAPESRLEKECEETLLRAVELFPDNKSICVSIALSAAMMTTASNGNNPLFLPSGRGFELVVEIAHKHKTNAYVLAACFRSFANIATCMNPLCANIGEEGSLEIIVEFLNNNSYNGTDESHVIEFGTLALANLLARNPEPNIRAVGKAGVLKKLVKLFRKVSSSLKSSKSQSPDPDSTELLILKNTAFVLAALNFEIDPKLFLRDIKHTELLQVMMKQAKQFKNKEEIIRFLIIILCNLSAYPELFDSGDDKVTATSVLSFTLDVMNDMMPKSQAVVNECLRLLLKFIMAFNSTVPVFCQKKGCDLVLKALTTHLNPSVTMKVAHIIYKLHKVRFAMTTLTNAGAVSALLNNLMMFVTNANCVKSCCSALCGLTARTDDVNMLIQSIAMEVTNEALASAALQAVTVLARENYDNAMLLLKNGIVASLAQVLTATKSSAIADAACAAVASLAGHDEKPSLLLSPLKIALANIGRRFGESSGQMAQMALDVMNRNADVSAAACMEKGFCTRTMTRQFSLGWTSVCSTCSAAHLTTMEFDYPVCDNCRKHCPADHAFTNRIFGLRACQCTHSECLQIGISLSGVYESKEPVKISFGSLCADEVVKAIAAADAEFKKAIDGHDTSSLKVHFIDTDDSVCEFYSLDCVPVRCGDVLRLRVTF